MVPGEGFEPSRRWAQAPKACVSANSTIPAGCKDSALNLVGREGFEPPKA